MNEARRFERAEGSAGKPTPARTCGGTNTVKSMQVLVAALVCRSCRTWPPNILKTLRTVMATGDAMVP